MKVGADTEYHHLQRGKMEAVGMAASCLRAEDSERSSCRSRTRNAAGATDKEGMKECDKDSLPDSLMQFDLT